MQALLTQKKQHSQNVWSFSFAPTEPLVWQAGQSVRLEIPGPYGPLEHRFSIASAPSSRIVTITTRLSDSDYKKSLAHLQLGNTVDLQGLEGNFVWRKSELPHIFVAAGVGITPFHAIITERFMQGDRVNATLLYSSRDEPILYDETLRNLANTTAKLLVQFYTTRITAEQILTLPQVQDRFIYISGPSKMVGTLGADLIAAGIAPAHVLRDQFTGRLSLDG